jgi:iron complex outermembrane receptor protein
MHVPAQRKPWRMGHAWMTLLTSPSPSIAAPARDGCGRCQGLYPWQRSCMIEAVVASGLRQRTAGHWRFTQGDRHVREGGAMSSTRFSSAIAVSMVAVLAAQAQAQQAEGTTLQEIVVTAQKRAESAQDVPISIVALTGEQLTRIGQSNFMDVAGRTPTLQYSQAGGEGQLYIRGIGSNLLAVGADPSVAIHLDGVYLGRPNMGMSQFLDVARVEVLRGPQGTLYGRNATGGSINIVSNQPTDELEGYVGLGTGSFSKVEAKGAIGGPINDAWGFRLAGRYVKDDGYVDDLDPRGANKLDNQDMKAVRGILRYRPSDAFTASLSWDYSDFSNDNTAVRPNDDTGTAQVFGAQPTSSILQEYNDLNTFMDWKTGGPTLTLESVGESMTATFITAWKKFEMDFFFNTDGTEIDVTRTTEKFDTNQLSSEFRVASNGDGSFNWIAGMYVFREQKDGALGLVRNVGALAGGGSSLRSFNIFAENRTSAWALFGEASYDITDAVRLTAGLRYSDERKDDYNELNFVLPSAANPASEVALGLFGNIDYGACGALCPFQTRTGSKGWSDWTPKVGIDWQPRDNVLLYASYTEGFKSGGYNDYQPTNPVYDPEKIASIELGAKTDWLDGRLRLNAAAFWYDYKDLQVTTFFQSLTLVSNAANATVKGIDLELEAKPTAGLTLGASLSFLDATYDRFDVPYGVCSPYVVDNFSDPGCADVPATRPYGSPRVFDASGNTLNNAPQFKGNAYAQYDIRLGNAGTLSLFGQVSHTDDIYFNAANADVARQSAYTLVDARVAWTSDSGAIELAAYGKNLTDEKYFHNIVQFTSSSLPPPATTPAPAGGIITDPFAVGHALGYPAPGATWGLEVNYRF